MVNGKVPSESMREAFDASLVLYAEHELNASTFSARVTVSTLSDIHSGIVAAIGTLKGPLHGGANEEAWKVLEQRRLARERRSLDRRRPGRQERIMGFGHRVYKNGDPRAAILKDVLPRAGRGSRRRPLGADRRADRAGRDRPEAAAAQRRLAERPALPLPGPGRPASTRRSSPWPGSPAGRPTCIEQLDHNRLMRPRGRYIGPFHRRVPSLDER